MPVSVPLPELPLPIDDSPEEDSPVLDIDLLEPIPEVEEVNTTPLPDVLVLRFPLLVLDCTMVEFWIPVVPEVPEDSPLVLPPDLPLLDGNIVCVTVVICVTVIGGFGEQIEGMLATSPGSIRSLLTR